MSVPDLAPDDDDDDIGNTENEFKTIFNSISHSFKLEHKRIAATLSDHFWELKHEKNIDFNIKWEIVKKMKQFAPGEKVCKPCLQGKFSILMLFIMSTRSLNKKNDFFGILCAQETILFCNKKSQSDEGHEHCGFKLGVTNETTNCR